MLDVRFLPNPLLDRGAPTAARRPTKPSARTSQGQPQYREFMRTLEALMDVIVPGYVAEGKSYLTIGVGCTGGRHRSVVVADALGSRTSANAG